MSGINEDEKSWTGSKSDTIGVGVVHCFWTNWSLALFLGQDCFGSISLPLAVIGGSATNWVETKRRKEIVRAASHALVDLRLVPASGVRCGQ